MKLFSMVFDEVLVEIKFFLVFIDRILVKIKFFLMGFDGILLRRKFSFTDYVRGLMMGVMFLMLVIFFLAVFAGVFFMFRSCLMGWGSCPVVVKLILAG